MKNYNSIKNEKCRMKNDKESKIEGREVENKYTQPEERCQKFALNVRLYFRKFNFSIINVNDIKQVIRSAGSIGANYIEANESLGDKDFLMRIKISRKEAKETIYWLKIIKSTSTFTEKELLNLDNLVDECVQLMRIFGSIYRKSSK